MASSGQLQKAIKSATHERLRIALLAICSKSEEASKLAGEELLVQSSAAKKRKSDDEDSTLRYEVCVQCKEEFDTTTNGPDSCQYHDGKALVFLKCQLVNFSKASCVWIMKATFGPTMTKTAME
jgi:hypothetical protein